LYGTIHLTDKKLFNFGDSLYHYLEQAEGFNIEVDADSMVTASVKMWTVKDNGRMLKSVLKKNEYDKYASKLSKKLNKPADQITTRDIWKLKNEKTATEIRKGEMSQFMDFYFYGIAKKQGKLVGGIEDVEEQLALMDEGFEDSDLQEALTDSIQDGLMLKALKEMYIEENLSKVEALFMGVKNESLRDKVLTKRNIKMAARMEILARLRSTFFAVGVAHLPGDSGLITLLKKAGYTLQPVFSSKKIAASNYTFKALEAVWKPYTHSTNLYSVNFPGTPQPMDAYKQVMDMQYYFDIPTSKIYYTAFVHTAVAASKNDSLFNEMIKSLSTEGKVISKKNIVKQGYEGRDVLVKAPGTDPIRYNLYYAEGVLYLAFATTKVEANLNDAETQAFFNSFSMTPKSSVVTPYTLYTDTTSAFSILLPPNPVFQAQQLTLEQGSQKQLVSTDNNKGVSFVVSVSNLKPGSYLESDTSTIALIKQNLFAKMQDDTLIKDTLFGGMPAFILSGSGKNESNYYRTITVLRGNRTYSLVSASTKAAAQTL
jgi:uncharacterized protein YbaP (TraB family)